VLDASRYLEGLKRYLVDEAKDKKSVVLNLNGWKECKPGNEVPQQLNGTDCGVFACTFADFLLDDLPFLFSQSDMASMREKIGMNILQGEIT
jgi:sentrin-specific protease 1